MNESVESLSFSFHSLSRPGETAARCGGRQVEEAAISTCPTALLDVRTTLGKVDGATGGI